MYSSTHCIRNYEIQLSKAGKKNFPEELSSSAGAAEAVGPIDQAESQAQQARSIVN